MKTQAMLDAGWGAAEAGALGFYGDFLYSMNQTRYGSGPVEALSGPTIGPLLELSLVQPLNAARAIVDGMEGSKAGRKLLAQELQDLKSFVPMGNAWYTKAALDHLVFQQIFESLSPGYLSSIRRRTMRDYDQDWWWQLGESTPERAPDFGAALKR